MLTDTERESLEIALDSGRIPAAVTQILTARETALCEEIAAAVRVIGGLIAERDALRAQVADLTSRLARGGGV